MTVLQMRTTVLGKVAERALAGDPDRVALILERTAGVVLGPIERVRSARRLARRVEKALGTGLISVNEAAKLTGAGEGPPGAGAGHARPRTGRAPSAVEVNDALPSPAPLQDSAFHLGEALRRSCTPAWPSSRRAAGAPDAEGVRLPARVEGGEVRRVPRRRGSEARRPHRLLPGPPRHGGGGPADRRGVPRAALPEGGPHPRPLPWKRTLAAADPPVRHRDPDRELEQLAEDRETSDIRPPTEDEVRAPSPGCSRRATPSLDAARSGAPQGEVPLCEADQFPAPNSASAPRTLLFRYDEAPCRPTAGGSQQTRTRTDGRRASRPSRQEHIAAINQQLANQDEEEKK